MADTTYVMRNAPTGLTFYCVIENAEDEVFNGTAFVPMVTADWASYAVPAPETPAGSRRYIAPHPTASPPGQYTHTMYRQLGASPAIDDPNFTNPSTDYWDGFTFGNVPGVPAIQATLDGYDNLIDSGTVDDPSPTATTFIGSSSLSTDSNLYRALSVCFTSGELQSAKAVITSYNGATKRFTFAAGFVKAPANGDSFKII